MLVGQTVIQSFLRRKKQFLCRMCRAKRSKLQKWQGHCFSGGGVCDSIFSNSFHNSLNTSHTERQSFMYLQTRFLSERSWLTLGPNFFSFFQWTSARVNANQGRCINGHLSHCMRRGLNVMLNCLSCALDWALHYKALGGLLRDLGDSSDL